MRMLIVAMAMLVGLSSARGDTPARRVAVVVGVGAYQTVPQLANPPRDARAIAAALQKLGFDTTLVIDPDRAGLEQAVRTLGDKARNADAAVFFYAGHALEADGRNFIIPVSAKIATLRDLPFETVDLDLVGQQAEGRARTVLVFMDACRDNPFAVRLSGGERGIRVGGGLAAPAADSSGTLVAYATAPGHTAADGTGADSPFTTALLAHIATPGLEVRQMLGLVRHDVREATDGKQVPWESSALEGSFYFAPGATAAATTSPAPTSPAVAPAPSTPASPVSVPPAAPPSAAPAQRLVTAAPPAPTAAPTPAPVPPATPTSQASAPFAPPPTPAQPTTARPLVPRGSSASALRPANPPPVVPPLAPPVVAVLPEQREFASRCHVDRVIGMRRPRGTETVMRVASDGRGCAFRVYLRLLEGIPFETLVASTPPANGTVRVNNNTQIVYTPRQGFVGDDVFVMSAQPTGRLVVRVVVTPPPPGQPG